MLKAIADRIIIKLDEEKSSQFLQLNTNTTPNSGIVESVGANVSLVKVGNHVIFHHFDELPLPQKNMVVIREKSLLGIYAD